ncbi:MAG: ParB/RepB/Spo0J family partition protein [Deltaproteobacteria bacterium]|nr:ParB/RepB/Spo0J family partition protein [Deltaproteobacteria bacterium]
MTPKKGLGQGIDALFGASEEKNEAGDRNFFRCPIEDIRPNRLQPRRFKPEADESMAELVSSVKEKGVIQPLLVRKAADGYELIAGERRWRAAQSAGLFEVPVVVMEIADRDSLELALIENLQRQDLNPIEEGAAYHKLGEQFNLTQEQIATRVGRERSTVTNYVRLLRLPEPIQQDLVNGDLNMGQARVLLGLENEADQLMLRNLIIERGLSARGCEKAAKRLKKKKPVDEKPAPDIYLQSLAEDLTRSFGTKVKIAKKGRRGKIEIEFYSNEDLNRIIELLASHS